ncbi:MAG: hypothetical protein GFH27_549325n38 [Chloroflexi bacterium AL-W]|nr:hypothetical protein [Chloroflexi bacterium AL-N1]NOK70112.1 hypothetical protein [Chloroflexi bacterium AL-N10]NOK77876.1 hypothetical protein [Chloroflexi bacterium AL-N5]NOK84885.1 hypothetical protein [Chloroflexi bacterium AL-W]NOK91864.1 hypothetical protein [Chloroflexi bacterium AL-N15]
MAIVLISLVGGRPLPNILLTLHFKPDYLYFIVSQDSIGTNRDYEKTLAALPKPIHTSEPSVVKPYIIQDTITQCKKIVSQHKNDQIIINTTLGPKTMAFGVYDVAKECKHQGVQIEVCYLAREGLVYIFDNDIKSVKIGLKDYFSSYGWDVHWKTNHPNDRFEDFTQYMAKNPPTSQALLATIRQPSQGKGKRTCSTPQQIDKDQLALLQKIEKLGFVSNVSRDQERTRWTINSQADGEVLIGGDWLEFYVYQKAVELTNQKGEKLFDECGWGVEDINGKGEIDFTGIFNGQIVIVSCKTEDTIKRVWFEELHSKMEQLGKGMCSGLLVSTVSKSTRDNHDVEKYQKWASERQIILVLAEDISNLPLILKKIVLADGKAEPKEIPIYPRI